MTQVPVSSSNSAIKPTSATVQSFFSVFVSSFITIFLVEFGDKTQLTTLLMSAQSHNPLMVFIGATLALILTSLLGVTIGYWLAQHIAPKILNRLAGMSMLLISVMLMVEIIFSYHG